ncbi:lipoprotein [Acinetobacter sp. MB5]
MKWILLTLTSLLLLTACNSMDLKPHASISMGTAI